jgi:hypothetical protein
VRGGEREEKRLSEEVVGERDSSEEVQGGGIGQIKVFTQYIITAPEHEKQRNTDLP